MTRDEVLKATATEIKAEATREGITLLETPKGWQITINDDPDALDEESDYNLTSYHSTEDDAITVLRDMLWSKKNIAIHIDEHFKAKARRLS